MKSKKIPTYLKYYLSKTRLDGLVFNKTYLENLSGTSFYLDHSVEDKMKINLKASESTQNSTTGINMFNAGKRTRSQFGITTNYNGSEFTINGTNTDAQSIIGFGASSSGYAVSLGTYPAGRYVFMFEKVSGNLSYSFGQSAFYLRNANSTEILSRTISSNTDKFYVRFDLEEDTEIFIQWYINVTGWTFTNYVCRFMITSGNTEHDYEPYTGGQPAPNPDYPQVIHVIKGDNEIVISNSDNTKQQNYPLTLGNLEMCNINNYVDIFFKNVSECEYYDNTLEEGKWYKYTRIDKDIFDGSETITEVYSELSPYSHYFTIPINSIALYKANSDEVLLCSSFIPVENQIAELYHGKMTLSSTKNKVAFGYNGTLSNFTTYLTNNNVTLYYVLETPSKTLLSDTLQEQLENIYNNAHTYNQITNINQVNDDRPFILDISYYRKVK